MLGSQNETGLLHFALRDIFGQKDSLDQSMKIKFYISYLEIYNENLIDLLNPKGDPSTLKIKEDSRVGDRFIRWES